MDSRNGRKPRLRKLRSVFFSEASPGTRDMIVGDANRVNWSCDQGPGKATSSELTKNSSKSESPSGDCASAAGMSLSESDRLAKSKKHYILYI